MVVYGAGKFGVFLSYLRRDSSGGGKKRDKEFYFILFFGWRQGKRAVRRGGGGKCKTKVIAKVLTAILIDLLLLKKFEIVAGATNDCTSNGIARGRMSGGLGGLGTLVSGCCLCRSRVSASRLTRKVCSKCADTLKSGCAICCSRSRAGTLVRSADKAFSNINTALAGSTSANCTAVMGICRSSPTRGTKLGTKSVLRGVSSRRINSRRLSAIIS